MKTIELNSKLTERSTSSLMKTLFGDDINIVSDIYHNRIKELSKRYEFLSSVFCDYFDRTSYILPYICAEYGYYSIKNIFMPSFMKELVGNFGLICLVTGIDDDIVDEYSREGNHLKMISNVSASECIQNAAYSDFFCHQSNKDASKVLDESRNILQSVWKYQYLDSLNIMLFPETGFDMKKYLLVSYKTGCYTTHGLRLGMLLAGASNQYIERAERFGNVLGQTLQFYDDLLDLPDDMINYDFPLTLPMVIANNNMDFVEVYDLIDSNLEEAAILGTQFPYTQKFAQLVEGFRSAKGLVLDKISTSKVQSQTK